jgi:hypothetical protein
MLKSMRQHNTASPRLIRAAGWAISIMLHGILAGCFLFLTVRQSAMSSLAQSPPNAALESENQPLRLDPVINDLKIEPFTVPKAAETALQNLSNPPSFDTTQTDDVAAITVADSAAKAPTSSTTAGPWQGDLPRVTGELPKDSAGLATNASSVYASRFCGAGGNTTCVCFAVDCSGSMVIAFDYVRQELKRAINQLSPAQHFYIIFFAGDQPIQMPQGRLLRATSENKAIARHFIEQTHLAEVKTADAAWRSVIQALQGAFDIRDDRGRGVDLIYLLTDGDFDHDKIQDAIRLLQPKTGSCVRINIIACGNRDNESYLAVLAKANSGQYTFLTDEDLARGQQTWP